VRISNAEVMRLRLISTDLGASIGGYVETGGRKPYLNNICTTAEALNSLNKRELIDFRGNWQRPDDVMAATADWVLWYNEVRLHSCCGDMPPKTYEEIYYKALASGKLRGGSQT
jgi:hypothetical protein